MAVLSKQFPGAILINYFQEQCCDFCGVTVAKNGVVREFCESMSEYRESFARKKFPDLDVRLAKEEQEFDEFFWDNCDDGDLSEYICDTQESRVQEMIQEVQVATQHCRAFG